MSLTTLPGSRALKTYSQLWGFRMLMSGFILFIASIMELFTSPFERVTRDAPQDPELEVDNGPDARH